MTLEERVAKIEMTILTLSHRTGKLESEGLRQIAEDDAQRADASRKAYEESLKTLP